MEPTEDAPVTKRPVQWRGVVARSLLVIFGLSRPEPPTRYFPYLEHYLYWYIVLPVCVGIGLSAARSPGRSDRLLGLAVVVVGGLLCVQTAWDCMKILLR